MPFRDITGHRQLLDLSASAPLEVSAADNRRAAWRLAALLIGLSLLIALSSAAAATSSAQPFDEL